MAEKRKHPRRSIESDVAFQLEDGTRVTARCRDLSLGGMFIETTISLSYGALLKVSLRLPGLKDETTVDSVVRWTTPMGMGVQFKQMGARETHALTVLLATG